MSFAKRCTYTSAVDVGIFLFVFRYPSIFQKNIILSSAFLGCLTFTFHLLFWGFSRKTAKQDLPDPGKTAIFSCDG
jgi:hypothetical protein